MPNSPADILIQHGFHPIIDESTTEDFLRACKQGYLPVVQAYLDLGMSTEVREQYGRETPLIKATEGQQKAIIDLLLARGADLEAKDNPGDTALRTAYNWGHYYNPNNTFEYLLKKGANPNTANEHKETLLEACLNNQQWDLIELLFKYGADPNFGHPNSPILSLLRSEEPKNFSIFFKAGLRLDLPVDNQGNSPLNFAIQGNYSESALALLKQGADPNQANHFGWTATMIVQFQYAHDKVYQNALKKYPLDQKQKTIVQYFQALDRFDLQGVQQGLAKGLFGLEQCNHYGRNALHILAFYDLNTNPQAAGLMDFFLAQGLDPKLEDFDGLNPVQVALTELNFDTAQYLVEKGCPINDLKGECPQLLGFAYRGYYEQIRYLLDAGAALQTMTPEDQDPSLGMNMLHRVVSAFDESNPNPDLLKLLQLLLQRGIQLDLKGGYEHHSPLMNAVADQKITCVRILLQAGANPNLTDEGNNNALLIAAKAYNSDERMLPIVQLLLEHGADFSHCNEYGHTAYDEVLYYGKPRNLPLKELFDQYFLNLGGSDPQQFSPAQQLECLRVWIQLKQTHFVYDWLYQGISATEVRQKCHSPLHEAASANDLELVRALLQYGADPNYASNYGLVPLSDACYHNRFEIVQALIKAGANPNHLSDWKESPINSACSSGSLPLLEYLAQHGAKFDHPPVGWTPALRAIQQDSLEILRWLVEKQGANPHAITPHLYNSYNQAIEKQNVELVLYLIEKGCPLNQGYLDKTPLISAIAWGNKTVIRAMLKAGADPLLADAQGETGLQHLKRRKTLFAECADLLKDLPTKPSKAKKTTYAPLDASINAWWWATYSGQWDKLQLLHQSGQAIDQTNYLGETALMYAVAYRNPQAIEWLLQHGANPKAQNVFGEIPWAYAQFQNWPEVDQPFLQRGLTVDMELLNQRAAQNMRHKDYVDALFAGDISLVESLIRQQKVNLHALWMSKYNPLTLAYSRGDRDMVELLLQLGTNPLLPIGSHPEPISAMLQNDDLPNLQKIHKAGHFLGTQSYFDQAYQAEAWHCLKFLMQHHPYEAAAHHTLLLYGIEHTAPEFFFLPGMADFLQNLSQAEQTETLAQLFEQEQDRKKLNKIVQHLLKLGFDPNQSHEGKPLLVWALETDNKTLVKKFLAQGADAQATQAYLQAQGLSHLLKKLP